MLSNSCLVLPAVVKQQQEDISRNHVPSLFAVSVCTEMRFQILLLASIVISPSLADSEPKGSGEDSSGAEGNFVSASTSRTGMGSNGVTVTKFLQLLMTLEL